MWAFLPKFPKETHFRLDFLCKSWALAHFRHLKICIYNEGILMYISYILAHFLYIRQTIRGLHAAFFSFQAPVLIFWTCICCTQPVYQCILNVYRKYISLFLAFRDMYFASLATYINFHLRTVTRSWLEMDSTRKMQGLESNRHCQCHM